MNTLADFQALSGLVQRHGDKDAENSAERAKHPILADVDPSSIAYVDKDSYVPLAGDKPPKPDADSRVRLVRWEREGDVGFTGRPHINDYFQARVGVLHPHRVLRHDSYLLPENSKPLIRRETIRLNADNTAGRTSVRFLRATPGRMMFPTRSFVSGFLSIAVPLTIGAAAVGASFGGNPIMIGAAATGALGLLKHISGGSGGGRIVKAAIWGCMYGAGLAALGHMVLGPTGSAIALGAWTAVLGLSALVVRKASAWNPTTTLANSPDKARQTWITPPQPERLNQRKVGPPRQLDKIFDYLDPQPAVR